jgi:uncharacterized membrane protein
MQALGFQTDFGPLKNQSMIHRQGSAVETTVETTGPHEVNVGRWERLGAVALGGFLLANALRKRNLASMILGVAGVSMLLRGESGYCPVYGRLGISSAAN